MSLIASTSWLDIFSHVDWPVVRRLMCLFVFVCARVLRPENVRCLPQLLSTFLFETERLTNLEFIDVARFASQPEQGILTSLPS